MFGLDELVLPFLTVAGTVFVAELTDKDALLILTLSTRTDPRTVFAAGSIAFTITSAVIVIVGSALILLVPITWIKVAGGVIMLGYALFQYLKGRSEEKEGTSARGERLAEVNRRGVWIAFFAMVLSLVVLDLAGDATELLTVVFVAQYRNSLLVFLGAAGALTAACGVEVLLGNRLGRLLSAKRIRYLSTLVFLIIGLVVLLSAMLQASSG